MTILVTGATGNVGSAVLANLLDKGCRVRALTRHPGRAALPGGVEVFEGDLGRPEMLAAAFADVEAVHLINYGTGTGAPLQHVPQLVAALHAARVRRVTTFRGVEPGELEAVLAGSGLEWTDFFIPVEFMSNALHWAESIRTENIVRAFGPARSAMIHGADIGAAIAAGLTEDGHAGKSYTLSGPQSLTPQDKVNVLSSSLDRPIRLIELSEDEAREKWRALRTPEPFIDFLVDWHLNTPESAHRVLPTVE